MEIHIDDIAWVAFAFIVARMRPLAADARIAQDRPSIHVRKRSAQLATVRDLPHRQVIDLKWEDGRVHRDAGLVHIARIEDTAAGYTTGARYFAMDTGWTGRWPGLDDISATVIDAFHTIT